MEPTHNNQSHDDPIEENADEPDRMSPVPGYNMSPVRPQVPQQEREPILPSVPRPARPNLPSGKKPTPTEEIDMNRSPQEQARAALDRLRQKMRMVAEEFSQGKLNRAQFHAIYQRYQEQRDITETMLQRDPKTGAWQNVMQPGHTGFLRKHFEAHVESYSIYHVASGKPIIKTGALQLPQHQMAPIIQRLRKIMREQQEKPGSVRRKLKDDRFVVLVPGSETISVVIFSLEPAFAQIEMIEDIHHDFERANAQILNEQRLDPRELVFPHRALFES